MIFQLHNVDTDGMILSMKTENIINACKNLEDIFNFSYLDENHELYSWKNEKVVGNYKIETPKIFWIYERVQDQRLIRLYVKIILKVKIK